jgi:hypothetical protein
MANRLSVFFNSSSDDDFENSTAEMAIVPSKIERLPEEEEEEETTTTTKF